MIALGPAGLPDIIVIVPPGGQLMGLEVKTGTGKQTDVQKAQQLSLESAGALYFVVRSVKEVDTCLKMVGL